MNRTFSQSDRRFMITGKGIAVASASAVAGVTAMITVLFYQSYYLGSALFAVFTLLFAFSVLFIGSGLVAYSSLLIPFGSAVFFLPKNVWALSVFLMACVFGVLSCWLTRREAKTNLSSHTHRPLRVGLPMFFTAVAVLSSLFYYVGAKGNQHLVLIPKKAFDMALPYISGSLVQLFPQRIVVDPNKNVDALLEELVRSQASAGGKSASVSLPAGETLYYIEEQRRELSNQLGLTLRGDERIGDVFYDLANKKAMELAGPYVRFMGIVLAAGLFFGLKAISIAMYWVTIALMPLLVWMAKKAALLQEETITVEVSRLSL